MQDGNVKKKPRSPRTVKADHANGASAETTPVKKRSAKAKAAAPVSRVAKPRTRRVAVKAVPVDTAARESRVVTDEDIRVRAYFLSLEYEGDRSDVDFWLLAERELRPDAHHDR